MTFGYDADIVRFWTIASSNRLGDHGKSLVYALLDQREQVGQRPIIFVAHSLGGLVCEDALNLSDKRQSLRSILSNTLGIVFMGTPHGGSYLAGWGSTVAKYMNVFRGTNREVLKTLQPGSSDLQRTEEDFQHMLQRDDIKIRVFCFYEAVMMNGTVGKIVESESAILAGYDNCSINADHRNMTKFTGSADAGYGQVRGVLKRWIQECGSRGLNADEPAGESTGGRSGREGASYHGPVFNGPISGHNVILGTQVTGGTTNFNIRRDIQNVHSEQGEGEIDWSAYLEARQIDGRCRNCGLSGHWENECRPRECGKCEFFERVTNIIILTCRLGLQRGHTVSYCRNRVRCLNCKTPISFTSDIADTLITAVR
jgi:protein SERAC1